MAQSPYTLSVRTSSWCEKLDMLATETKDVSKLAAKLIDDAAEKLARATDILQKEAERRRAIKERAKREIEEGNTL